MMTIIMYTKLLMIDRFEPPQFLNSSPSTASWAFLLLFPPAALICAEEVKYGDTVFPQCQEKFSGKRKELPRGRLNSNPRGTFGNLRRQLMSFVAVVLKAVTHTTFH